MYNSNEYESEAEFEAFLNSSKCMSVVNILTKHKIKLWEAPDFASDQNQEQLNDLLMKLSDESGLMEADLKQILIQLQRHSVKKLEENKKFQKDGSCVFRVKVIGSLNQNKIDKSVQVNISMTGTELKNFLIQNFQLDCDNLKIICNGKVIKDNHPLFTQDIKNHSTLMALCVYEKSIQNLKENRQDAKMIMDIKEAINLLASESIEKDQLMSKRIKLQNQNGFTLKLSENDQSCLTMAMILHEKSKFLIKKKNYFKALILLAEADKEFLTCQDKSLLQNVDNYALLNLDIIWCYLNLESLNDLKNAEERLKVCEDGLKKCYGADLSRLMSIKSDMVNKYTPIFVRLNMLKAILKYHRGRKNECKDFLDLAMNEMKKIMVDDDKVAQVMSMGFNNTEAKLALRATFNNVEAAVEQIFKKKQIQLETKLNEKRKALEEKYGRCVNLNQGVDPKILQDLIQFGYNESQAAKALIQSDNNFNLALDFLQVNEDRNEKEAVVSQLVSMGFDRELCTMCVKKLGNDLEKIVDYLNKKQSKLDTDFAFQLESDLPCCSNNVDTKKIEAQKIIDEVASELPEDDEAYLDFNIEDDLLFINKYYSLLDS